jgi:crotonobetainyl-CoA:carnitine CoA-transferase CaiB-like acyl-CoA transferase
MLGNILSDIRVLEFTQAIMGPSCGVILADMGAEVVKVEPIDGDNTRRLQGFGIGFFAMFNRNKKSLAVNLKSPDGKAIVEKLLPTVDVIIENFAPNTMTRLGFGYEQVSAINPQIVYCSLKGYMDGPYEHRTALDEPVQMQSGLAYMTGPPGQPLRAGASVTDILSGTYGVVGILGALREREKTGLGSLVQNGLFETATYLMGQHLAYAVTESEPIKPFPGEVRSWAIYRIFKSKDQKQIFIGVTSNQHWESFCKVFERPDLFQNPSLADNNLRYNEAGWLLADLEVMLLQYSSDEILNRCKEGNFPFSPVNHPEDLWNDPHLATRTWLTTQFPDQDFQANLPRQPLQINHRGHDMRLQPPKIGEHTAEIMRQIGFSSEEITGYGKLKIVAKRDGTP